MCCCTFLPSQLSCEAYTSSTGRLGLYTGYLSLSRALVLASSLHTNPPFTTQTFSFAGCYYQAPYRHSRKKNLVVEGSTWGGESGHQTSNSCRLGVRAQMKRGKAFQSGRAGLYERLLIAQHIFYIAYNK